MDGGLYIVTLRLDRARELTVGKLGRFSFPAGYYVYVGRAIRGLYARAARHRRKGKTLRWHIDYIREVADWVGVEVGFGRDGECGLARKVAGLPEAREVVPGFGASDCRCRTHLFYFERWPWEIGREIWNRETC